MSDRINTDGDFDEAEVSMKKTESEDLFEDQEEEVIKRRESQDRSQEVMLYL